MYNLILFLLLFGQHSDELIVHCSGKVDDGKQILSRIVIQHHQFNDSVLMFADKYLAVTGFGMS